MNINDREINQEKILTNDSLKEELCSTFSKNILASQVFYYFSLELLNFFKGKKNEWTLYHRNQAFLDLIYRLTYFLKEKNVSVPEWLYITPVRQNAYLKWQADDDILKKQKTLQEKYFLLLKTLFFWPDKMEELKRDKISSTQYPDHFFFNLSNKDVEDIRRAILKSIFILRGTLTISKHQTRIELRFKESDFRDITTLLLNYFELNFSISKKNKYECIYFKKTSTISTFLAIIGASKTVLAFEDYLVKRSLNSKVNRSLNCDVANINRQVVAGQKQVEFFSSLIENDSFLDSLSLEEKELVYLRLQYPSISLAELGQLAKTPLNKARVYYILNKIKRKWA